jgi:integrative and conjugative element protein (TIGR02256 family)
MSKCWIENKALDKMRAEGMKHFPLETGGCLMGYRDINGDMVIVDIVGPGPDADHQAYEFAGNTKWQDDEVKRIFDAHDGDVTYIGDWHTHPNQNTLLSEKDIKCLDVIATTKEAYCPKPLMLVLGKRLDLITIYQYPEIDKPVPIKYYDLAAVHG